jgi:sec-independent protein translocase protein TatA
VFALLATMFGLGTREIIILAAVLVLLFGAKKIPELARSLGEAVRHIRNGFSDNKDKDNEDKAS